MKHWLPWLYENDTCIACDKYVETIDHFMSCTAYETNHQLTDRKSMETTLNKPLKLESFGNETY